MAATPKKQKMYVRPTPEARHALKRLLTALQSPALFGDGLLQEDLVAATWLWLAGMPLGDVAAGLEPHLRAVRDHWAGGPPAPAPSPPAPGPVGITLRRGPEELDLRTGEPEAAPKGKSRRRSGSR